MTCKAVNIPQEEEEPTDFSLSQLVKQSFTQTYRHVHATKGVSILDTIGQSVIHTGTLACGYTGRRAKGQIMQACTHNQSNTCQRPEECQESSGLQLAAEADPCPPSCSRSKVYCQV